MFSKKSKIAVIGAGKIAFSLIYALKNAGYNINTIISRNLKSAENLAEKLLVKNYSNNFNDLSLQTKIFFLSVPDNQINVTVDKIADQNLYFQNSLFIHLSGTEDITNLNSLKEKGALTASFHIMQTFPSKKIIDIKNCYAAVETDNKHAENYLFKLASELKLKPFKLKAENKARYHLAGVFASNFLVGNIFNSEKIFNISKKDKNYNNYEFLIPIIKSTLHNIKKLGSPNALSGPIERGDITTIEKHISSLKKLIEDSNEFNKVYFSYVIQSLNLLNVVKYKYKEFNKGHLEIQQLLIEELRSLNDISED